ncbi:MAG TPA: PASTA domain-containing protein, partial [Mycobacteriales bacterium]|nr:PASTA domain-containing protein [Mycobacteriales bacterium]
DPGRRQPSAGDFGRTALALATSLRGVGEADAEPAHPPTKLLTAAAPVAAATDGEERERRRIRNIFIAVGAIVVVLGFLLLHSCGAGPSNNATPKSPGSARPSPSNTTLTVRAAAYIGRPATVARAELTKAGFNVTQTFITSDRAAGSVVGVSPTGALAPGSTITLTVAKATPPPPRPKGHKKKHGGGGD